MSQPDVHQTFLAAIESAYQVLDNNFDDLYAACHSGEEKSQLRNLHAAARDAYWRGVATRLCDDNSVVRAVYDDLNRANQELRDSLRDLQHLSAVIVLATQAVRLAASLVTLATVG